MSYSPKTREISYDNLLQFNLYRLTILSIFFAFAVFVTNYSTIPQEIFLKRIIEYVIASYFVTILIVILLSRIKKYTVLFANIQFITDLFLTEYLIYSTGGIDSPFTFLLLILVLSVSYFFQYWINIFYAIFAGIIYTILVYYNNFRLHQEITPDIFIKIFYLFSSMLIFSLIGSYIYERFSTVEKRYKDSSSKLYELENLYKTVIDTISSGIIIVNPHFEVVFENFATRSILGSSIIDLNILDIIPDFKFETVFRKELSIDIYGKKKYIGYSSNTVRIGEEINLLVVFQDLTDIRILEEKMLEKEKLATVGEIVMNITHDLRNPLASINGSIELILEELQQTNCTNPKIEKLAKIINRENTRVEKLLQQLLNFSKKLSLSFEKTDIKTLILEIFEEMKNQKKFSDLNMALKINGENTVTCIDKFRMGEVFQNLIKNSFDAINDKDGKIFFEFFIENNNLIIKHYDTGPGIDNTMKDKIFKPFFTGKKTGTGLGLSIVKKIILEHSGDIVWDTNEKKFIIKLPLRSC